MEKVSYSVDEYGVALLKISNPPMNTLDEVVMSQMEDCLRRIPTDEAVKVVVITGDGPTFVVGADVNAVNAVDTFEKGVEATSKAQEILNLIESSRKPFIAAINGMCLGGGTELALACHMRIAAEGAQMGLPEIMLGIMPGFGGTQRMTRLLGTARALEYMLTAKFIGMKEAERVGLVNRVVPDADLLAEVAKLAKSISKKGQIAVRSIVEAAVDGGKMSLEEGLKLESRLFGRIAESEDKKEGIRAFLEKRKPVFKDR
ncbi:MAG TPA: enoyl-CoA hydratase-related protein [Deltaproteobacteria bacterium]|nr:enoyl-CoA hydratase-related protein [Deltaproteobacteria bacterium]HQI00859.1 enoyl-CoA hydratase-related protein [Deltaproteobacteria bacterium]